MDKSLIVFKEELCANFNLSVVIPFYKKMKEFKRVFPLNRKFFERNGIEVLLVLDCPDEKEELLDYVKEYPFINWKIILNDKPHDWRNPSKPINVGIKFATKKYVMVCSPESEFMSDAILLLREALEIYPQHFAIGRVCFTHNDEIITIDDVDKLEFIHFGSIMVERKYLFDINGYDETLSKWGGDDNNVRARLEIIGVEELYVPEVILLHRDFENKEGKDRRAYVMKEIPNNVIRHFFYPSNPIANGNTWGEDFDTMIYDWQKNDYAEDLLSSFLQKYDQFVIKQDITKRKYKTLLLAQSFNESKYVETYLLKMSKIFDGIILLDDGSIDDTYERAASEKLILKVKKQRDGFDDLLNRNTLLNIASFFQYEWACFLDLDEILDARFDNLNSFLDDKDADSFIFNLIQLWDNEATYNSGYPYTFKGISLKYRMFRNIGHSQIYSNRGKLHFNPLPAIGKSRHIPILIKHFGNLTKDMRIKKYHFYQKEDVESSQFSYEHLLNEKPMLGNVKDITVDDLHSALTLIRKKHEGINIISK